MSKIFSFNQDGSGSYLDSISGTKGVNTNGEFKKTEKGEAWLGNGVDSKIDLPSTVNIGKVHTIVIDLKSLSSGNHSLLGTAGSFGNFIYFGVGAINYLINSTSYNVSYGLDSKNRQLVIVRDNTSLEFFIDGVSIGTDTITDINNIDYTFDQLGARVNGYIWDGYISKMEIESEAFTQKQINSLYKDFLRNKGTGASIHKNGFPIKSDDLSNKDGLVASYNMIPS